MESGRPTTFAEFWPYYVKEHGNPLNRGLHYLGTTLSAMCVWAAVLRGQPAWLLVALVAGYGPAWIGHFWLEHNRPATFRFPVWSLLADIKMLSLALRGEMAAEAARLTQTQAEDDAEYPSES